MRRSTTALTLAAMLGSALVGGSSAQPPPRTPAVRPWTPPGADTILVWAAEARAAFRAQPADSIDPATQVAFDRVGSIAWRFISQLGRQRAAETAAVEAALDSLGFDTDMVIDPEIPSFMFLVVRNPHRLSAQAEGFFFWYRGDRLLLQGMPIWGGRAPWMRVWWNNDANVPYEWGLVDRARDGRIALYLLRMTSDGGFWRPFQWPGRGPEMGRAYEARWVDFNGDGRPELKTWERAKPDSLFTECPGCPQRLIERTYVERLREGFDLSEQRFLPTPYATFTEFVRSLVARNRTAALGCVSRPELVDQAQKLGWGSRTAGGTWAVERAEQEPWPRWLALRFASANGPRRYVVRFTEKEGRWLIEGWRTEASGASATEPKP